MLFRKNLCWWAWLINTFDWAHCLRKMSISEVVWAVYQRLQPWYHHSVQPPLPTATCQSDGELVLVHAEQTFVGQWLVTAIDPLCRRQMTNSSYTHSIFFDRLDRTTHRYGPLYLSLDINRCHYASIWPCSTPSRLDPFPQTGEAQTLSYIHPYSQNSDFEGSCPPQRFNHISLIAFLPLTAWNMTETF